MDDLDGIEILIILTIVIILCGVLFKYFPRSQPKYRTVSPQMQETITALKNRPTEVPTIEPTPYPTYTYKRYNGEYNGY